MPTGADSRPSIGRAKVIIVPEDTGQQPFRMDVDGLEFCYERGVCKILPAPGAGAHECRFEPNGQARLHILAWCGCATFDEFESITTRDLVIELAKIHAEKGLSGDGNGGNEG